MNEMTINYEITTWCNQSCKYCKQHDESVAMLRLDKVEEIIDRIFSLPKKITKFCFYGGEPTMYPRLFDVIQYTLDKNPDLEIFIHSNMKKPFVYYEAMAKMFPDIKIAASFQIHQMKDPHKQVEKIISLHKLGVIYCCDFSLEYDNFQTNIECFWKLKKAGVLVKPMPIIYLKAHQRKIADMVNKKYYSKIWDEDKYCEAPSETKDKLCLAGFNYLFVRHNGDAIRCTTYRTRDPEGLKYGNILTSFSDIVSQIDSIQPCKLQRCTCPTELNLK